MISKEKWLEDAITSAAVQFQAVKDKAPFDNNGRSKVPNGTLKLLIAAAAVTFELSTDQTIKAETVRSRFKRGNLDGRVKSPLDAIEPTIVMFCNLANFSGISLDQKSFIKLVNSLIEDSLS